MAGKQLFEKLHLDFSNALRCYLVKNNVDLENSVLSEDESEKLILVTKQFISEHMAKANVIYAEIKEDQESKLFNIMFNKIWGQSIRLSEIHEHLVSEIAAQTTQITLPINEENTKEYVLVKLLSSAARTYQEIVILLKHGYPYGAISLTRVLFEIAIITRFIANENEAVALEYYKSTSDEVDYNSKYEWARASGKFGNEKESITIKGLRVLSGFKEERYINLYTVYCNFAHSAPQIVNNDVDSDGINIYAGPKMCGIDAPGSNAAALINDVLRTVKGKNATEEIDLKIIFCLAWEDYLTDSYTRAAGNLQKDS